MSVLPWQAINPHGPVHSRTVHIPITPASPLHISYRVFFSSPDIYPFPNLSVKQLMPGVWWKGEIAILRCSDRSPAMFVNMRAGDKERALQAIQMYVSQCLALRFLLLYLR